VENLNWEKPQMATIKKFTMNLESTN